MSYDQQCEDLARAFLCDDARVNPAELDSRAEALAQEIQDAIGSYLVSLDRPCFDCGRLINIPYTGIVTPPLDDDLSWKFIAFDHEDDCAWVATRGYRR